MKKIKIKSLTMRIWTTFTFIILAIIFCISVLYLSVFRAFDESNKVQDLVVAHENIKDIVKLDNKNYNEPIAFDKMRNLQGIQNFVVIEKGNVKTISEVSPMGPRDINKGPSKAEESWMMGFVSGVTSDKQFKEYYNNKKYLFVISEINSSGTEKQYLVTYMPYFKDNAILYEAIIISIVFIIIGFFTAKIVASYISKPLKELEKHTKRISNKDWNEPIEIESNDEIGSLAKAMNTMQNELRHAEENEKMFLQSISHDLKTPVMVIMSHAQAIIDGVYIDSIEKTAEIIKDEAERLDKKIKQMLYLNTLDYVLENNVENETIDMNKLLNKMLERFELFNCDIQFEACTSGVKVFGNYEKINVSIENILENALRYAKKRIKIVLKKEEGFAFIEIYNDGRNIESNNIDRIFDNLYKDKTGNFGLGLAICKKIIDFYGGSIKAVNREIGVSFIIRYPMVGNDR